MADAVLWLLAIEAIGLIATPIAFVAFGGLSDRGLTLAKPLGILSFGYLTWILSSGHIAGGSSLGPPVAMGLLALFSAWIAYKRRREMVEFIRRRWKVLVAAEIVFLALYAGWTLYRTFDPAINHTEQPMDLAMLNASMRTEFAPPIDPWLSGESVSYYYFGYWMMGMVANLAGIAGPIAYNLSLSLVPAMAAAGAIGLVYNLAIAEGSRPKAALACGAAAAVLLVAAANLEVVLELMRSSALGSAELWDWMAVDGLQGPPPEAAGGWRPTDSWWWWRATRVINTFEGGHGLDYTIHEFPFFSAMLGDLHPHFMSLPFVVLFLGLCVSFLSSPVPRTLSFRRVAAINRRHGSLDAIGSWSRGLISGSGMIFVLALVLGGLGFISAWDLPVFAAIFVIFAALRAWSLQGRSLSIVAREVLILGTVVIGLAFLLYLPYFGSFQSQFSGIRPVTDVSTRPIHFLIVWGLLLVAVVPMLVLTFWRTRLRPGWRRLAFPALIVGLGPFLLWIGVLLWGRSGEVDVARRILTLIPLSLLISAGVYSVMWNLRHDGSGRPRLGLAVALALATLGMLLMLGPELLFVGDHFGTRMNTVFKFYYQAWVLLALAGGFALYYMASVIRTAGGMARVALGGWAALFCVLVAVSLYYPAAALASKPDFDAGPIGLDGLAHIDDPAERGAIAFLLDDAHAGSVILEGVGSSYSEFGRISAATGMPAVLGWPGHEAQWRGSAEGLAEREGHVREIYETRDPTVARNLLSLYGVDYVYVGPRERRTYDTGGVAKFDIFMDRVYSSDSVVIYGFRDRVVGD